MHEEIIIPPEVQALLDAATPMEDSPYGVAFTANSAQLRTADGKTLVKEVPWADAGKYGLRVLRQAMKEYQP